MDCRPGCAACCVAPSISSPIPGMPGGKPAGVPCVQLLADGLCAIWGKPEYPKVCRDFKAQKWVCGDTRTEALKLLMELEENTRPR